MDILSFHRLAYQWFGKKRMHLFLRHILSADWYWPVWKQVFSTRTFYTDVKPIIDGLAKHQTLIEQHGDLRQYQTIQRHWEVTEKEIQYQRAVEQSQKHNVIRDWLNAAAVEEDQETKSDVRYNYPGVCKWILSDDKFKRWREGKDYSDALFWMTGIPGSGKLPLSRQIIGHCYNSVCTNLHQENQPWPLV